LSADQKAKRVDLSGSLLHLLENLSHQSWSNVITLDESWFYFENDEEQIWISPHEKVPERSKHMIQSRKVLVTLAWNAHGFHLIKALPKGMKFNSTYYIHEILTPLLDWYNTQFGQTHQNLVIHADNARPHIAKVVLDFCEENGITLAPHPPYSPDLAPSDFYLFGFLKDKLKGCVYDEPGELLGAIGAILEDVDPATLERVFRHWMKKLEDCISGNGEYTS
jgi:histone-lysine N-methyltransferase SETMAR